MSDSNLRPQRSWRCSMCAVNYPLNNKFKTCPRCDEPTWSSTASPDEELESATEPAIKPSRRGSGLREWESQLREDLDRWPYVDPRRPFFPR